MLHSEHLHSIQGNWLSQNLEWNVSLKSPSNFNQTSSLQSILIALIAFKDVATTHDAIAA